MKYQEIKVKKVLQEYAYIDGGWTWAKYSADPYFGCGFGCEYCYEWDPKYTGFSDPEEFNRTLRVKINAAQLLAEELEGKERELIHVGDWQEGEREYRLSRQMLEVCLEKHFPVFILEKSPIILDDIGLIQEIAKDTFANVAFSIITTPQYSGYDQIRFFENDAPPIEKRFQAMEKLAQKGIMTGTVMMPIIPFIFDAEENIDAVCRATKDAGGKYVVAGALTLEGYQKERFYNLIRKNFADVLNKYVNLYYNGYTPSTKYMSRISEMVSYYCEKYGLLTHMPRYIIPGSIYVNKKVAEYLYNAAQDIEFSGVNKTTALSYRNVAHFVDGLEYDLKDVFDTMGKKGLEKIPGIGPALADKIAEYIKKIAHFE